MISQEEVAVTEKFRKYVTGSQFFISLSESMIEVLLWLHSCGGSSKECEHSIGIRNFYATSGSLVFRGMVVHNYDHYNLTKPGQITAELLLEAGFRCKTSCVKVEDVKKQEA